MLAKRVSIYEFFDGKEEKEEEMMEVVLAEKIKGEM